MGHLAQDKTHHLSIVRKMILIRDIVLGRRSRAGGTMSAAGRETMSAAGVYLGL